MLLAAEIVFVDNREGLIFSHHQEVSVHLLRPIFTHRVRGRAQCIQAASSREILTHTNTNTHTNESVQKNKKRIEKVVRVLA